MNVRDVVQALAALERAAGRERLDAAARALGYERRRGAGSPALVEDLAAGALLRQAAGLVAPERPLDLAHPPPDPAEAVDGAAADAPLEDEGLPQASPKRRRPK